MCHSFTSALNKGAPLKLWVYCGVPKSANVYPCLSLKDFFCFKLFNMHITQKILSFILILHLFTICHMSPFLFLGKKIIADVF